MPQGIEIKTLDDLPGFASQEVKPGMQIAPLTPPTGPIPDMDMTGITPVFDPAQLKAQLDDITRAQQEQIGATSDAIAANTLIQTDLYDTTVKEQQKALDAMTRLQRIADNPFSEVFAIFDPKTWSTQHQLLDIEKSQLKLQQKTLQSQSLMNINNQVPALKKSQVEIAQAGFANTKEFFGVLKDISTLTKDEIQTRINAADLRIRMSQEVRAQLDLAGRSLSLVQAKALLKKPAGTIWEGREGILEDIISRHEKSDLDVAYIKSQLAKNNFDLAEARMDSLIQSIDFGTGEALVQQAISSGAQGINYKGINIPLGRAIIGLEKVRTQTESFERAALGRQQEAMNEQLQTLTVQNSALAKSPAGPRAAQRLNNLRSAVQAAQAANNPMAWLGLKAHMDEAIAQTAIDAKRASSVWADPQARAGVTEFFETGSFSQAGATPVVVEAIGRNTAANSAFPEAWAPLIKEGARRIQQLQIREAPSFDGSTSSANQIMSWAFRTQAGNKKVSDVLNEVVQSGFGADEIRQGVTTRYRTNALKNVFTTLAEGGLQPFVNVARDPSQTQDKSGQTTALSLATYFEQQSMLTGNKVNYLDTFIQGLETYSTNSASMTADPNMQIEDYALLSNQFNGDPQKVILDEFIQDMKSQAMTARSAISKGIQEDVTGVTQRRALANMPTEIQIYGAEALLQKVPSATGIGTAEEIKAIFGTDPRFGTISIPQKGSK